MCCDRMTFRFYVRSHGTTDSTATNEKELCFNWLWSIVYNNAQSGRIRVSSNPSIKSRCDKLPATSIIYGLSLAIMVLAFWYQFLLCKAVWRQLIILNDIQTSTLLLIDEKKSTAKSLDRTNAIQRQLRESQQQRRMRESQMSASFKRRNKNFSGSASGTGNHVEILNASVSLNRSSIDVDGGSSDDEVLNDLMRMSGERVYFFGLVVYSSHHMLYPDYPDRSGSNYSGSRRSSRSSVSHASR